MCLDYNFCNLIHFFICISFQYVGDTLKVHVRVKEENRENTNITKKIQNITNVIKKKCKSKKKRYMKSRK